MATAATVSQALEHFLAGALWLNDLDLEATIEHGIGLVLRSGPRKVPGLVDAVRHLQRAISIRHQIEETLAAVGAQIDLTSVLLTISPFAELLADAPEDIKHWKLTVEAYLEDAVDQLAAIDGPVAKSYLGEAFFNRSCQGCVSSRLM